MVRSTASFLLLLVFLALSQSFRVNSVSATSQDAKFIPMREGTPSLRWDSDYSKIYCPNDATLVAGSTDTRGTVMIPNMDLAHTDFSCVIKFSQPYPSTPICAVTGIGLATPMNMTFKIHSVTTDSVEVKGKVNSGSGGTLAFNYICM